MRLGKDADFSYSANSASQVDSRAVVTTQEIGISTVAGDPTEIIRSLRIGSIRDVLTAQTIIITNLGARISQLHTLRLRQLGAMKYFTRFFLLWPRGVALVILYLACLLKLNLDNYCDGKPKTANHLLYCEFSTLFCSA